MSSAGQSISYLDLSGNLVVWGGDGSTLILYGTHFKGVPEILALVISGLCLVAFIGIMIWLPCVYLNHKRLRRFLTWSIVGCSAICMTIYFGLDVANRIFHELELTVPAMYIAIDVPVEKLVSLSEILLLVALLHYLSPALQENVTVGKQAAFGVGDVCIVILVVLLNVVGGVLYIYNFVMHNMSPPDPDELEDGDNTITKFVGSVPWLNAALNGLYLLGSISFAVQTMRVRQELDRTESSCKTLRINIPLLAISFASRSLVRLVFFLVFELHGRWATYYEQLIHMAFYGPLSVIIYASFVRIAAVDEYGIAKAAYSPVEEVVGQEWAGWQQKKQGYVYVHEMAPVRSYSSSYGS